LPLVFLAASGFPSVFSVNYVVPLCSLNVLHILSLSCCYPLGVIGWVLDVACTPLLYFIVKTSFSLFLSFSAASLFYCKKQISIVFVFTSSST